VAGPAAAAYLLDSHRITLMTTGTCSIRTASHRLTPARLDVPRRARLVELTQSSFLDSDCFSMFVATPLMFCYSPFEISAHFSTNSESHSIFWPPVHSTSRCPEYPLVPRTSNRRSKALCRFFGHSVLFKLPSFRPTMQRAQIPRMARQIRIEGESTDRHVQVLTCIKVIIIQFL
jgi:hypothetical protein